MLAQRCWHRSRTGPARRTVAEAGVRVERMKIESDPNFKPAVPVVAVAVPFRSTVQLPFPEKGASVSCWERDTAGVSESFLAVSPNPI